MILTREQAIKEHRKMYNAMADEIEKNKCRIKNISNWKENYIGSIGFFDFDNNCFLCEYTTEKFPKERCEFICPLIWGEAGESCVSGRGERMNPQLDIGGVIVTQYDSRRLIDKEVLKSLTEAFPGKVFETTVSNSVALVEAPSFGKDIFEYKPSSKPEAQYEAIVNEIMKRS